MSSTPERIGQEFVSVQPSDPEILSAFILYSPEGIPQDEARLAQGIQVATEVAPFLSRFVDSDTGGLTDDARGLMEKLQEGVLLCEGGVFKIDPSKVGILTSSTRVCFKDLGIERLKTAAGTAQRIWSI